RWPVEIRLLQPACGDAHQRRGGLLEEPLACGASISTYENRIVIGSFRGAFLAGFASPCLPGDGGVRFPGSGAAPRRADSHDAPPAGIRGRGEQPEGRRKKWGELPTITVPGIRRAMQGLIVPLCHPGCPDFHDCIPSPRGSDEPAPTVHPP